MKQSQTVKILNHLKKGYKITPLEALKLFGCFRLGARIWELKKEGYKVASHLVKKNGKYVAEYEMIRRG